MMNFTSRVVFYDFRPKVEKFREKYGAKDVKKYYSRFDVAVAVQLT